MAGKAAKDRRRARRRPLQIAYKKMMLQNLGLTDNSVKIGKRKIATAEIGTQTELDRKKIKISQPKTRGRNFGTQTAKEKVVAPQNERKTTAIAFNNTLEVVPKQNIPDDVYMECEKWKELCMINVIETKGSKKTRKRNKKLYETGVIDEDSWNEMNGVSFWAKGF